MLQGTAGTNWLRPNIADEFFALGQPLDAAEYFMVMPDAIGRGGSSKPSDGLKGKFLHYRYHDIVESSYRLITESLGGAPICCGWLSGARWAACMPGCGPRCTPS